MGKPRNILFIIVRSIALTVLATLLVAMLGLSAVIVDRLRGWTKETIKITLDDSVARADTMTKREQLAVAMDIVKKAGGGSSEDYLGMDLAEIAEATSVDAIDVVDRTGQIVNSSDASRLGRSYADDPAAKKFYDGALSQVIYVSEVESWPLWDGQKAWLAYEADKKTPGGPVLVVATSGEATHDASMRDKLVDEASYRTVGEQGYLVLCNPSLTISGCRDLSLMFSELELSHDIDEICDKGRLVEESFFGRDAYILARRVQGTGHGDPDTRYLLGVYLKDEDAGLVSEAMLLLGGFTAVLFAVLVMLLSRQMRKNVADPVSAINRSLDNITAGKLEERVDVTGSVEFEGLSQGINTTVDKLKELIEQEATRIDEELRLARTIQHAALPNVFPPFPERTDVGLFASMDAAKEVGGDFYDFFLVSDTRLAVVVADVSDKGIPAAMFMMRAKTAIKALAVSGLAVDEVIARANDDLCEDNEAGMFVTLWMGILNLDTGVMEYVHAGHTCPVLLHGDDATYVKKRRNFIVGARPGMRYVRQELRLQPRDALFLYSDGVTEAFDAEGGLYGGERLERVLAQASGAHADLGPNGYCEAVCKAVGEDVAAHAAGAEQSDDITMLCIRFEGQGGQV